ncbi:MAG TPA: integrase core domain-containing protein [Patescibacteria group bacterium]|nr:integrase core domain-containing protein [Patescibacteria group bacterium]
MTLNMSLITHCRIENSDLYFLREAEFLVKQWRKEYNQVRPHSSLGYRPPAPVTREPPPMDQAV